ncbi:hypothetical protein EJ06DRAFT_545497 [Trichodelitschia bisporula]|uniref:L-ornithine N(5)-monooxygenase [NAD(P)H] n=1 Tax=Trichodelitschia bisporula TaxID=703511 RepID=A0A6G1I956_9PEZI|nr:hypothetical protein EJ06DRAFT_545497 [Trichodelitschia bisporula]
MSPPQSPSPDNVIHDILFIGLGPSTLSLAIALSEQSPPPKTVILERSPRFVWSPSTLPTPRAPMRTSLLHDLTTPRNPHSQYTFLNYLVATDSLVAYTNLGAINPPRALFARYLAWVAKAFEEREWVRYGADARAVEPVKVGGAVDHWRVRLADGAPVLTRKVVVAVGAAPQMPASLSGLQSSRVLHTSAYGAALPRILAQNGRVDVAIVGGGEEALEVYNHLRGMGVEGRVVLFHAEKVLRGEDANPYVRNLVAADDPVVPYELRNAGATAGGEMASAHTITALYEDHYAQHISAANPATHDFQIRASRRVMRAEVAGEQVRLHLADPATGLREAACFDFVIVAGFV